MFKKTSFYVNVGQVAAIIGATVCVVHYLNICRDATGIQKKQFKDRVIEGVTGIFGGK